MTKKKEIKRTLVVSGGGAFGAWGAGIAAGLNKKYDVVAGISTGALMSPLVALNEFDILKKGYTSVSDSDIYDLKWYKPKPVTKKGKINIFAVLYALIFGKESLATANGMRKTIDRFLVKEHYDRLRASGINVLVGGQNLREKPSKIHYFDIQDHEFEDFKDWMWTSAVAPFYTNLVEKEWTDENGEKHMGQWTDGGVSQLIPLAEVFNVMKKFGDCKKEIDVIIHRAKPVSEYQTEKIKGLIDNFTTILDAMRYDIEFENILEEAETFAKTNNATVNVYFMPRKLAPNSMVFDKKKMESWWDEAYTSVGDETKVITFK